MTGQHRESVKCLPRRDQLPITRRHHADRPGRCRRRCARGLRRTSTHLSRSAAAPASTTAAPPTRDGLQLDLTGSRTIVDYTPRDMTILVEAGVRMADLAATLAAEGQQLPIDVPRAAEATLGGVVATNWTGPRRLGYGTIRDYVIGIHAVDGRGVAFKGGGRVVKNVAGYDFCKLLTGSLGTLGVITQLALKVKPLPEQSATVVAACPDLAVAETILGRLVNLAAPPVGDRSAWSASAWNRRGARPKLDRSHAPRRSSSASKAPKPKSTGSPSTCSTNSGKAARTDVQRLPNDRCRTPLVAPNRICRPRRRGSRTTNRRWC